jgi:undecaprenyl-diphosphatase
VPDHGDETRVMINYLDPGNWSNRSLKEHSSVEPHRYRSLENVIMKGTRYIHSIQKGFKIPTAHELLVLLAVFFIVAGTLIFIEIADEVLEGDYQHIDEMILTSLRHSDDAAKPRGPEWLEGVMRDITALGGSTVITLLTLILLGFLTLQKEYRSAVLIATAYTGGFILVVVLKFIIARERPDIVPHLIIENTPSFPSGHSTMSAVIYLSLAASLAHTQTKTKARLYIIFVALVFTLLIGVSRIYLGVHYPSDVLAGWLIGLAWASFCWFVAYVLTGRE